MDPADVLADLGAVECSPAIDETGAHMEAAPPGPSVKLSDEDAQVAAALRKSGGSEIAALIDLTDMPAAAAMRSMTSLELLGVVSRRGQYVTLTSAGMAMAAAQP
jgi:hypothetical protein